MKNPFTPADTVQKKLKVLLFGSSGSGKTRASLTFPRVAMVDAEGGADLYAGSPDLPPFQILRTKTISELREAIAFVRDDNGRTFDTLVIDPITVFYDVLKESVARRARDGQMGFREWARVNTEMKGVYNDLTQLPLHVVVIARESMEYEGSGHDLKKVGVKPDSDRSLAYTFDFVVRLQPDHSGVVVKSRGVTLGNGGRLPKVEWSAFEAAARLMDAGNAGNPFSPAMNEASDSPAVARSTKDEPFIIAEQVQTRQNGRLYLELADRKGRQVITYTRELLRQYVDDAAYEMMTQVGAQVALPPLRVFYKKRDGANVASRIEWPE